jgi:hypothetical protein
MLERTAILPNLERANLLLDVLERLTPAERFGDESEQSRFFGIFRLLSACYAVIADDLLILSAFEIHAKAVLLKSGYVIHEIRKPAALKSRQRERPIHVRTIRAAIRSGDSVVFAHTTLGIKTLLQSKYITRYPVPLDATIALEEVRTRRNYVHFAEPYAWGVDRNLLELVAHLNKAIPTSSYTQKRRR